MGYLVGADGLWMELQAIERLCLVLDGHQDVIWVRFVGWNMLRIFVCVSGIPRQGFEMVTGVEGASGGMESARGSE